MTEIVMPRLSDSMEEGTIVQWYVKSGDIIKEGQAVAEIETDKATMDYESDCSGEITLLVEEGETIPLGQPIARVNESSGNNKERVEEPVEHQGAPSRSTLERTSLPPEGASSQKRSDDEFGPQRKVASPLAKRIASENDLSLSGVVGSGPGGRIVQKDVRQMIEKSQSKPQVPPPREQGPGAEAKSEPTEAPSGDQKLSRIEEIAARRMIEAKGQIPHFYLQKELDITELYYSRERIKEKIESPPSINDFFIRAVAKTLESHPRLRSRYEDGKAIIYPDINIGFATATDRGLIVPVLHQANRKSVSDIAAQSKRLLNDAHNQKISPTDLEGSVFTISNLGMYGVDSFSAIITPGQSAVLAIGQAKEKPVCLDGEVVSRRYVQVTLSCDHRVVDGRAGALFLEELAWRVGNALGAAI